MPHLLIRRSQIPRELQLAAVRGKGYGRPCVFGVEARGTEVTVFATLGFGEGGEGGTFCLFGAVLELGFC